MIGIKRSAGSGILVLRFHPVDTVNVGVLHRIRHVTQHIAAVKQRLQCFVGFHRASRTSIP